MVRYGEMDIDNVIMTWQENIQSLDYQLDEATSGWLTSATMRNNYLGWHANAQYFEELSGRASQDEATFEAWKTAGQKLLNNGKYLADLIQDSTISGTILTFLGTFPSSLKFVATETLSATGSAIGSGLSMLPWWIPVLGLGALFLYFMPKKSSSQSGN